MAEAFLKKYAPHTPVSSAGTRPASKPNNIAVEAMREVGIDISKQKPQVLTKDIIDESEYIVNMGCLDPESCPALFVEGVSEWDISDPRGKDIEYVRQIRDVIKSNVKDMIMHL